MLKIRDGIDLKELEKFGFELDEKKERYCKKVFLTKFGDEKTYYINTKDRTIIFNTYVNRFFYYDDVLFDLIEAGLVEKINKDNISVNTDMIWIDLRPYLKNEKVSKE